MHADRMTLTYPPEHFLNRELSLLQFQRRVLAQAADPNVPLLERLRFLCMYVANGFYHNIVCMITGRLNAQMFRRPVIKQHVLNRR